MYTGLKHKEVAAEGGLTYAGLLGVLEDPELGGPEDEPVIVVELDLHASRTVNFQ